MDRHNLKGAVLVLMCMMILGFSDNLVRFVTDQISLWQFHVMRGLIAIPFIVAATLWLGKSLWPKSAKHVALRTVFYAISMYLYFAAIGFMPVALVAAGMFLAPILLLIFSAMFFGEKVGIYRIMAVLVGFAGVILILRPFDADLSLINFLPIIAAFFYAFGLLFTRHYCADEDAGVVVLWFFIALLAAGVVGMIHFTFIAPVGADSTYLTHAAIMPDAHILGIMAVISLSALVAMTLQVRGYQIADASVMSVFEYSFLLSAGFWGWMIWGDVLDVVAILGMVLIAAAGSVIAFRSAS